MNEIKLVSVFGLKAVVLILNYLGAAEHCILSQEATPGILINCLNMNFSM